MRSASQWKWDLGFAEYFLCVVNIIKNYIKENRWDVTSFAVDFSSYSLMESNQLILQINYLAVIYFPSPINIHPKKISDIIYKLSETIHMDKEMPITITFKSWIFIWKQLKPNRRKIEMKICSICCPSHHKNTANFAQHFWILLIQKGTAYKNEKAWLKIRKCLKLLIRNYEPAKSRFQPCTKQAQHKEPWELTLKKITTNWPKVVWLDLHDRPLKIIFSCLIHSASWVVESHMDTYCSYDFLTELNSHLSLLEKK